MEQCSETSAYKIQTRGNHPKESIQHSGHGENLISTICLTKIIQKKGTCTITDNSYADHGSFVRVSVSVEVMMAEVLTLAWDSTCAALKSSPASWLTQLQSLQVRRSIVPAPSLQHLSYRQPATQMNKLTLPNTRHLPRQMSVTSDSMNRNGNHMYHLL